MRVQAPPQRSEPNITTANVRRPARDLRPLRRPNKNNSPNGKLLRGRARRAYGLAARMKSPLKPAPAALDVTLSETSTVIVRLVPIPRKHIRQQLCSRQSKFLPIPSPSQAKQTPARPRAVTRGIMPTLGLTPARA